MAAITIQKSAGGTYFTITPTGNPPNVYPMNSVYMTTNGNNVSLNNIYTGQSIFNRLYSDVINGDTSGAFANVGALQTYILANFFK